MGPMTGGVPVVRANRMVGKNEGGTPLGPGQFLKLRRKMCKIICIRGGHHLLRGLVPGDGYG